MNEYNTQRYERCHYFSQGLCKMKRGSAGDWLDDSCDLRNDCEYCEV